MTLLLSAFHHGGIARWRRRLRRLRKRWRRTQKKLNAAPFPLKVAVAAVSVTVVFLATNLVYHVARKPTEMLWFTAGARKAPAETWRNYAPLFRSYSTGDVTPEVLAALAQVEGAGDPMAHTYWRWQLAWDPFRVFAPASSSVGMYQMTDAAFAEARHYCIRDHTVRDDCWFNFLYTRILPSNAVELAAIFLQTHLSTILSHRPNDTASPEQKQDLAAVIYLCGPSPAEAFVRHGFKLTPGEHCGDKDAAAYLGQFNTLKREFLRLAIDKPSN